MDRHTLVASASLASLLLLAACGGSDSDPEPPPPPPPESEEAAPQAAACPDSVPAATRCLSGQDSAGAYYLIALPAGWQNGPLVLHAHGGPSLGAPTPERSVEDLQRWNIMVRAGYAWAGSTFRQGGVEVRAAAEDTERLRKLFRQHVGVPSRTVLHGQSWGAGVAAKGAEMFTEANRDGTPPYDAVLLTSGVLAGGTQSYDFRLDLRVVYQYLCDNHPRPDEPPYALNLGLPAGATLSPSLASRVNQCLGLNRPAAERSAEQQARVQTIVDVIRIPETSIQSHLNWATNHFQDISANRTGGASPFGNIGVYYTGSADDAALNAGVLRYRADPQAYARFAEDTDPNGRIPVPVLSVRGTDDPTAFVELDSTFLRTMQRAGTDAHLVQTYVDSNQHSYLGDAVYPALMLELLDWVNQGTKPSPASVAQRCTTVTEPQFGEACKLLPDYRPAELEMRIPPRQRP